MTQSNATAPYRWPSCGCDVPPAAAPEVVEMLTVIRDSARRALAKPKDDRPSPWVLMAGLADAAEQGLAALRSGTAGQWRPISEAPRDGTPVLITGWEGNEPGGRRWQEVACFVDGDWRDTFYADEANQDENLYPPTHFMPLPAPPAAPATAEEA